MPSSCGSCRTRSPDDLVTLSYPSDRAEPAGRYVDPNLVDWREQGRSFAGMTFYRRPAVSAVTFAGSDAPQRAQEGLVGPEFFELLGTPPLVGRTFGVAEFERRESRRGVERRALAANSSRGATAAVGQTLIAGRRTAPDSRRHAADVSPSRPERHGSGGRCRS